MIADPFHAYVNSRPSVDWNTCGSAAIATITDYHGLDPLHLDRTSTWLDGQSYWDDGAAIDAVRGAGFGPDVVFGWGTTGGRVREALQSFGLGATVGHSRALWDRVRSHLAADLPVPVMVDLGVLGGPRFGVHWAIAYQIDGDRIALGNCPWNPAPALDTFLNAWQCWFLPHGFQHCAVFSEGPARLDTARAYRLTARHSGKVLDVSGVSRDNGARVQQWDWHGGDNQTWRLARQPDGSYAARSVHSDRVLDVRAGSGDDGAPVIQWDWHEGANQKWRVAPLDDGGYRVTCAGSGKALTVAGGAAGDGAPVVQAAWTGAASQRWSVEPL